MNHNDIIGYLLAWLVEQHGVDGTLDIPRADLLAAAAAARARGQSMGVRMLTIDTPQDGQLLRLAYQEAADVAPTTDHAVGLLTVGDLLAAMTDTGRPS